MHTAAAGWVMATLAPSPVWVGLIQTAATLPIFLFAIPAGIYADLNDRRNVLLFSQAFMAVTAFTFGVVTGLGIVSPPILLVLTFLLGTGVAINNPAWHGVNGSLVAADEVTAAVSLHNLSLNIGRAIGPALAGLVLAHLGPTLAFLLNAASFLGVIVVLLGWRGKNAANTGVGGAYFAALVGSFPELLRYGKFRRLLLQSGIFYLGAFPRWAFLPVISKDMFASDAGGFGLLMTCLGAGAAGAAGLLTALQRRFSLENVLSASVFLYGLAQAGVVLFPRFGAAAFFCVVAGAAWFVVSSFLFAIGQMLFPAAQRSRAVAFQLVIVYGGQAAGSALSGALAPTLGVGGAVVAASLLLIGATLGRVFARVGGTGDEN
jgi:MFS family permease